ncbi:MAG: polysaccharide biosynthesis protein, partial [Alphaproteobacteria bacterium]|nr:polysaccharide biosynthesis protein [Alphaproteobacteria bacterium]
MMDGKMTQAVLGLTRAQKRLAVLGVDIFLCLLTVWVAYYLRLSYWSVPKGYQLWSLVVSPIVAIPIFIRNGLYRSIFRYAGWYALAAVVRACAIYGLVYITLFTIL